jgi:CubicO group peptidase (beta-lactamase class C family)
MKRVLWLVMLFVLPAALHAQRAPLNNLSAYIEKAVADWKIPGLAIAVVKNDSVVYAQGFGVREVGKPDRVDTQTLFAIGSSSKAFTAAAVGMLVDEKKLTLNDPATRHLPSLELFDPYATRELTVRDLLSHRSGLARGDQLWYATSYDRDEILRRVRFLEPSWSFRSQFGYQNIMYLAAGQLIPALTRKSWDDFIDERIFTPLGMTRSNTSVRALPNVGNVAQPHAEIEDKVRAIRYRNIDNIGPAGSINSNALEMAQWVRLQLNGGVFQGDTLLSTRVVREMHTPHTIIPTEGSFGNMAPTANFLTYGLGWILHDYRGRKVVQHGGNIDGMHALVGMLPEEKLGLVVLTNLSGNALTYALMYRVFDAYLGGAPTDWSARYRQRSDSTRAVAAKQREDLMKSRVAGTKPSLALAAYAGTYRNEMYGDAEVKLEQGELWITRGEAFVGRLEHWHYDTFRADWRDDAMGETFVTFSLDPRARVATLEIQGLPRFTRAASPRSTPSTN